MASCGRWLKKKGGYQRKNAPNRKVHGNSQVDGEVDWSFTCKISNQGLRDITNFLQERVAKDELNNIT